MKKIIIAVFCLCITVAASAQEVYSSSGNKTRTPLRHQKKKGFDPQKLIFGGGLGLGFGDVTQISVAPLLGYRFTDKFSAGVELGYEYFRVKDFFEVANSTGTLEYHPLQSSFFYPSIWARYVAFRNFFVHAQYEYDMQSFTAWEENIDPNTGFATDPVSYKLKYNSPALLLGVGLRQPISERASFVALALYDVIQNKYSPYLNRIDLRVGLNIGF